MVILSTYRVLKILILSKSFHPPIILPCCWVFKIVILKFKNAIFIHKRLKNDAFSFFKIRICKLLKLISFIDCIHHFYFKYHDIITLAKTLLFNFLFLLIGNWVLDSLFRKSYLHSSLLLFLRFHIFGTSTRKMFKPKNSSASSLFVTFTLSVIPLSLSFSLSHKYSFRHAQVHSFFTFHTHTHIFSLSNIYGEHVNTLSLSQAYTTLNVHTHALSLTYPTHFTYNISRSLLVPLSKTARFSAFPISHCGSIVNSLYLSFEVI
jgi:hypothetical protein